MSERILLPVRGDEPKFNEKGFIGQLFSKDDVVCWIKWTNSTLMALLFFAVLKFEFIKVNGLIPNNYYEIGFLGGLLIFILQEEYDKKVEKIAAQEWSNRIRNKEKTIGMI